MGFLSFLNANKWTQLLLLVGELCAECYSLCRPCLSLDLGYGPALSSSCLLLRTKRGLDFFIFFFIKFIFTKILMHTPTMRYNLQPIHPKKIKYQYQFQQSIPVFG